MRNATSDVLTDLLTDVLIAGGGPAGLATALALRQRGIQVTVADAMRPPIDKACGEGLMPDSLEALASLGVNLASDDGAAFQGIRFVNYARSGNPSSLATARFPTSRGIGIRRPQLHSRLVEAAEHAGVRLLWQSPVQLQQSGHALVAGNTLHYGWLIGADGHSSRVRRWAGLERGSILSRRFGFRRHFRIAPWSPYVEVHWGQTGQAYVTPVGPDEVSVAAVVRDPQCRLDTLLNELPALRAKLAGSVVLPLDRERGAETTTRRLASVTAGRVALVGDASGSVDAITGEGLGLAFRQALHLAQCLESNSLQHYNRLHAATLKLPQTMARVMLWMDRSEMLRNRAVRAFESQPALFSRLLGVHLGHESVTRFAAAKGLQLALQLARP